MTSFVRLLAVVAAGLPPALWSADWPQFLGPNRDGRAAGDVPLIRAFADGEAKMLWQRKCGSGFAGPVISGGQVYLFHREAGESVVESIGLETGKSRWRVSWPCGYRDDFGFDDGPRSSPTVSGGRVYCYGADGLLTALDGKDGSMLWQRDMVKETGSPKGFFGRSSAPLVVGGMVLLSPGGEGAAAAGFAAGTGELKWKALDDEAGYASPVVVTAGGEKRVAFFTREGVALVHPETGAAGPSERFRSGMEASVNAASPVVTGPGRFFTSACYGTGAAVWEAGAGGQLKAVWRKEGVLDCHYATPVLCGEVLIGFHGRQEEGQELRAVAVEDGSVRWSLPMATGHVIASGEQLLILTEKGELILGEARQDRAPQLVERVSVLRGGHRSPPALAEGMLVARDGGRVVCVDLRAASAR
jgi:outer membrane protein assembly factor BamB